MRAIQLKIKPEEIQELANLYEETKDVKLKLHLQAVLLSAEQNLKAAEIARILRKDERTVQRWLKSYRAANSPGEMLWRLFRKQVTHGELFTPMAKFSGGHKDSL